MPFQSQAQVRSCKYCPDSVRLNVVNGVNKGYLRTCGSQKCLNKQYVDAAICASKSFINGKIKGVCQHCKKPYVKSGARQKWCLTCAPNSMSRYRIMNYGLSDLEYKAVVKLSKGVCPICKSRKPSCVDHNHKTGEVRGFICNACNFSLGGFLDNPQILENALSYLKGVK
jgi:hypothetical protein